MVKCGKCCGYIVLYWNKYNILYIGDKIATANKILTSFIALILRKSCYVHVVQLK